MNVYSRENAPLVYKSFLLCHGILKIYTWKIMESLMESYHFFKWQPWAVGGRGLSYLPPKGRLPPKPQDDGSEEEPTSPKEVRYSIYILCHQLLAQYNKDLPLWRSRPRRATPTPITSLTKRPRSRLSATTGRWSCRVSYHHQPLDLGIHWQQQQQTGPWPATGVLIIIFSVCPQVITTLKSNTRPGDESALCRQSLRLG